MANNFDDFSERRDIAVHAVDCFYGNEEVAMASLDKIIRADHLVKDLFQSMGRVVCESDFLASPRKPHTIMDASVNELIVHDEISRLWQTREESNVCIKAGVAQEACLCSVEIRNVSFQLFGVGGIPVEKSGATTSKARDARRFVQFVDIKLPQLPRRGQGQKVIAAEVDGIWRWSGQSPDCALRLPPVECFGESIVEMRVVGLYHALQSMLSCIVRTMIEGIKTMGRLIESRRQGTRIAEWVLLGGIPRSSTGLRRPCLSPSPEGPRSDPPTRLITYGTCTALQSP